MIKCINKQNLFTLFLLMSLSTLSHAVSFTGNAKVTILESIELTEQKIVDFGELTLSNGSCDLTASGEIKGSNGATCSGNGQVGEILIAGTVDQSISISVEPGDAAPGLAFTPALHSDSIAVLEEGVTTAKIGGMLDIDSASAGTFALTYVVVVNYD